MAQEDVSSEMDLPATFDDYLGALNTKQRHEVRRKLTAATKKPGQTEYRLLNGDGDLGRFDWTSSCTFSHWPAR